MRLFSADAQVQRMLEFEAAWSEARGDSAAVATIAGAEVDIKALRQGMARDGVPVPDLVRQLREVAGADVHRGATSQDVVDTALALSLRDVSDLFVGRLAALRSALEAVSAAHGDTPLMGRTRMQAATQITVSDRLSGWLLPLGDHQKRLEALRPQVEQVQIGGASGDRAALGADADRVVALVAERLGLGASARAWHVRRDGIGAYGAWLSLVSGTLGKMGQDICLMAQQGVGEIRLKGGGGSSAMPHKANPVAAELLVSLARFNAAQLGGLHQALVHEQERSGAAWTLEWMILPQMAAATGRGLAVALEVAANIEQIGSGADRRD